jgi:hypothetical protein
VPPQTLEFFQTRYFEGPDYRRIDSDWLSAAEDLALNLDSDTNNTSLSLAFELGERGVGRLALVFLFRFALGPLCSAARTPGGLFAPVLVAGAERLNDP